MPSLPRARISNNALPQIVGKRQAQIGAKGTHAFGDSGVVGANAHGPSVNQRLDIITVVADFPVHTMILAYLRRYVQFGMMCVTWAGLTARFSCGPASVTFAAHVLARRGRQLQPVLGKAQDHSTANEARHPDN